MEATSQQVDPITFEVISHKFAQLTSEQATTLQRTSGSVVVTEAADFAVSLADEAGSVFAVGDTTTMHSVALESAITWTVANRSDNPGIEDGDMFLVSDPWVGVVHQPDMAMIAPIFVDGEIIAWAALAMHMLDTGGTLPGGQNTAAPDVFSEAAPIPPVKIVRGGVIQRDVEEVVLRRSRLPQLLALDLRAMLSSNQVAIARMRELAASYGTDVLCAAIKRRLDNAEAEVRARLRELPDGRWSDTQLCEVRGDGDRRVYAVRGTMEKSGEELSIDLSATDDQAGFLNSTWPSTQGGLMAAVLPMLCPDLTWAPGGILRAMEFKSRPGSIVSAEFPASVSAGPIAGGLITTTLTTVLIGKMLSAAAPKLKQDMFAVTAACIPANIFRGSLPNGQPWIAVHTDAIPGGTGARSWRDGDDYAGISLAPTSRIPNIEHGEHSYPLLWLFRRELPDSAGAGEYRGGVGGESALIPYGVTEQIEMMVAAYGVAMPSSRGINGGLPAKSMSFRIHKGVDVLAAFAEGLMPASAEEFGGEVEWPHPKTATAVLGLEDVYLTSGPGGGGYGDPLDRDPAAVARDLREGYVSSELAATIYGVVFAAGEVDGAATEKRRAKMRGERIGSGPIAAPSKSESTDLTLLTEGVGLTNAGDTVCVRCSTQLSGGSQDFRSGAVETSADLMSLGLIWVDPHQFVDADFELRQFCCPKCATLLETELVLADDEVKLDRELFLT